MPDTIICGVTQKRGEDWIRPRFLCNGASGSNCRLLSSEGGDKPSAPPFQQIQTLYHRVLESFQSPAGLASTCKMLLPASASVTDLRSFLPMKLRFTHIQKDKPGKNENSLIALLFKDLDCGDSLDLTTKKQRRGFVGRANENGNIPFKGPLWPSQAEVPPRPAEDGEPPGRRPLI